MSAEEPSIENIQDHLSSSENSDESHGEMKDDEVPNPDTDETSIEGGARKEPWTFSFEFTHEPSSIYNQISTYVSAYVPYLEFIHPIKTSDLNEGGIKLTGIYDDWMTTQYGLMVKTSEVPVKLPHYEPNVQIKQTYKIKPKHIKSNKPSIDETKTSSDEDQTKDKHKETSEEGDETIKETSAEEEHDEPNVEHDEVKDKSNDEHIPDLSNENEAKAKDETNSDENIKDPKSNDETEDKDEDNSNEHKDKSKDEHDKESANKPKPKDKSKNKPKTNEKSNDKTKDKAKTKPTKSNLHEEAQYEGGKVKSITTVLHQAPLYLSRMHGWRNTYTSKYAPAEIYKYVNAVTLGEEIEDFFEELGYFSTGNFIYKYIPEDSQYLSTLAYYADHQQNVGYTKTSELKSNDIKELFDSYNAGKFTQIKLDHKLGMYMRNPQQFFDELKRLLKYDEDTGFWCSNGVQLICEHLWMLYQGKPLRDIYNLCANDKGMCKYCGTVLPFNPNEDEIVFTDRALAVVYSFVNFLQLTVPDAFLMKVLLKSIGQSILALHLSDKDFELKSIGFLTIYLFKLYSMLSEKWEFMKKHRFLESCAQIWNENGWNDKQVHEQMQNDDMFKNIQFMFKLIDSYKEEAKELRRDPYTAMNLFIHSKTPWVKLYEKDPLVLGKIVDELFMSTREDQQAFFDRISSSAKGKTIEEKVMLFKSMSNLYQLWWRYICPKGSSHDFNDKGICKNCGISDSNVSDIYKKYEKEIQSKLFIESETQIKDDSDKIRTELIEKIKKSSPTKPKIDNIDIMLSDVNIKKTWKVLEDLAEAGDITELAMNKENAMKIIGYLTAETEISLKWIELELNSIYHTTTTKILDQFDAAQME